MQTLERFQGKGRAVLTASDSTQYAFEGDDLRGSGTSSVFTRYLVEAISSGAADLDEDGDIALDELYSYVYDRVVAEVPQQRPKKQEDVDGRILIARNIHWKVPAYLQHAIESPIAAQRLNAVQDLGYLYGSGNDVVRTAVNGCLATLASDDSRAVSSAATALLERIDPTTGPRTPVDVPTPRAESVVPQALTQAPPAVPPPAPPPVAAQIPPPAAQPPPAAAQPPPAASEPPPTASKPSAAVRLVLWLIVLSAVPLTLSRLLSFETSYPYTADAFSESTVPWTLAVVVPLVAAVALLALRNRLPWALPPAAGLLLGTALILTGTTVFWTAFFLQESDTYSRGPAVTWLTVGSAVVAAAAVVVLIRSPLAGRPALRSDWRIACALVALAAVVVAMSTVSEAETPWIWIENNVALVLLGLAVLPLTLLVLRSDQAVAGLIAVILSALWVIYFLVLDYVQQQSGIEPPKRMTEIVCIVLAVAACVVAQAGSLRSSAGEPRAADHR
jgi:hypothetical protein